METSAIHIGSLKEDLKIFKANYHMNYGKRRIALMKKLGREFETLGAITESIYTGGIFKRIFVDNPNNGIPYISAQHMMNTYPVESSKLISRKFTPRQADMTLHLNHILVSCAGTVGNVRLITEELDGVIGSQDIIRVISNEDKSPFGFVYAYLSSPTAYNYIQSYIYGSVVPRIEPNTLSKLPVPKFSDIEKKNIHNLVAKAMELRKAAGILTKESEKLFEELNELNYYEGLLGISENQLKLGYSTKYLKRFTTSLKAKNYSFRVSKIIEIWGSKKGIILESYLSEPLRLGQKSVIKRINDSHFKGRDFISQMDLHKANPNSFKKVKVVRLNQADIGNEKLVLFPAVGNASGEGEIFVRPILAYKTFLNQLLSGDIGKFSCKSLEDAAYLYVALKSKAGFRIMRAMVYGTQLRRPTWELLKGINIPLKDEDTKIRVSSKIISAMNLQYEAQNLEKEAIKIIEKDIESWQN